MTEPGDKKARGTGVVLATRAFRSQKDAKVFFSEVLNRNAIGARIEGADHDELVALLALHPEQATVVGVGIQYFQVVKTEHGSRCFRVVRTDDTGTVFSIGHCVQQRLPPKKTEVSRAFRHVVRVDIWRARDAFLKEHLDADGYVTCAATKAKIRPEEGHMDHRAPMTFEVIVTTFLGARKLTVDDVEIVLGRDDQTVGELADRGLGQAFRDYHATVARLDFVLVRENLMQGGKHRLKAARMKVTSGKRAPARDTESEG